MMTYFWITISYIGVTFIDSILSVRLNNHYDVPEDRIGFIYLIQLVVFLIGVPILGTFAHRIERRVLFFIGLFTLSLGIVFTGPS